MLITQEVKSEELEKGTRDSIAMGIRLNLYSEAGPSAHVTLDHILAESSTNIITNFKTKAINSYDKAEFIGDIPKELAVFLEKDPAMAPGSEVDYHKGRMDYLRSLSRAIEKDPAILKSYEQFLLKFFYDKIVFTTPSKGNLANAWLQALQLENNVSDIYTLLSAKKFGFDRYITGIGFDGKIYSKPLGKVDIGQFYTDFHSHAPVLLSMDPEPFQDLIPNGADWASNPERLKDYSSENNGILGNEMLRVGQQNKHFHSSMPHQVIIKDRNIKNMIVKDDPPKNIYFSTVFSDGTVSVGSMSTPYENGVFMNFLSDLFSGFVLDNVVDTPSTYFLFDLAGCIARDMFICEEKSKFYSVQEVRAKSGKVKEKKGIQEKVIWLPRFKVNLLGGPKDIGYLTEQLVKLSPSHVSGHARRCENPSQKQVELAEKLGVVLPTGFTYVREHDRSGSHEFTRLYKSRSALSALYGRA